MPLSDAELVARALTESNHDAFGELVHRHQSPLRAWLRRLTGGDFAAADDLAQETFLTAYRQLSAFRHEGRFVAWLFSIAYNRFRTAARRRWDFVELDDELIASLAAPGEPNLASDLRQDLEAAVASLTLEQRSAITLSYQQGLTHQEIALVMNCPPGTVKTHILRGKERMLRYFQKVEKAYP